MMDLQLDLKAQGTKEIYERLMRLDNIRTYKYNISVLEQMTYEEVTHIFVRINSGGTKLSSADLTLAQISSRWRGVTKELDSYERAVKKRTHKELDLETGILLRAMSVVLSGRAHLSDLFRGERQNITEAELKQAWRRVKIGMDVAIDFLRDNCKIDKLSLLPTQYVLITLTIFFIRFEDITPEQSRDLQRWVYMALIWTRYSGSAETSVEQDIAKLSNDNPNSIEDMVQNIEDIIGRHRSITERELQGQLKKSPHMLMLYVLARQSQAQDWFNGIQIGSRQSLEVHHIFPKNSLSNKYNLKKDRAITDSVANLAFLSQKANLKILSSPASDYLPNIHEERLEAQLVPTNPKLWQLENFETFLLERRKRIADAINDLLNSLSRTPSIWPASTIQSLEERVDVIERQMRELISAKLIEARGKYADDLLPTEIRKTLTFRIEQHLSKNPVDASKFLELNNRLKLAQFSDYAKIVKSNWTIFQADFGDQQKLSQQLEAITVARNAFKHNNELSNADRAQAEAGLIWVEDCLRLNSLLEVDDDDEDLEDTNDE